MQTLRLMMFDPHTDSDAFVTARRQSAMTLDSPLRGKEGQRLGKLRVIDSEQKPFLMLNRSRDND